jgi:lysophospholipase L1-like esterase
MSVHRRGIIILAATVLWLAATALNAAAAEHYLIDCVGDEFSYNTYPPKLQTMLSYPSAYTDRYSFEVRTRVAPGRTAAGILASMENDGWMDDNPNCVIIMAGSNDLLKTLYSEPDSDKAVRDAAADVQRLVDYVAANTPSGRPTIILSTIPPTMDYTLNRRIEAFNFLLISSVYNVNAIIDGNWHDFYDTAVGLANPAMMKDQTFPGVLGNWEIAYNFYYKILSLIDPSLMSDSQHY